MALKVIIPSGQTEITVNGLHQWDYGQKIEIHSDDLPAEFEVHFSCVGMDSAVVRACNAVNGVAEVVVPDRCLEQTSPIVAWVYVIEGTTGTTTKTIILPIIARTRPQLPPTDPEEYSDKYTELITAVNAQVNALKEGDVTVSNAVHSENAEHATSAGQAETAGFALKAGEATTASSAAGARNAVEAERAEEADHAVEADHATDANTLIGLEKIASDQYYNGNPYASIPHGIQPGLFEVTVYVEPGALIAQAGLDDTPFFVSTILSIPDFSRWVGASIWVSGMELEGVSGELGQVIRVSYDPTTGNPEEAGRIWVRSNDARQDYQIASIHRIASYEEA